MCWRKDDQEPELATSSSGGSAVDDEWARDVRVIRRKRAVLMGLGAHFFAVVLANVVAWPTWAATRSTQDHRNPGSGVLPEVLGGSAEGGAVQWPVSWQTPTARAGGAGGASSLRGSGGGEHEAAYFPWVPAPRSVSGLGPAYPWAVWVTFGTGTLFAFHLANVLPVFWNQRGCARWHYYVAANLLLVALLQWVVYGLTGGSERNGYPWPWWSTAVALLACAVIAAASLAANMVRKFIDGGARAA